MAALTHLLISISCVYRTTYLCLTLTTHSECLPCLAGGVAANCYLTGRVSIRSRGKTGEKRRNGARSIKRCEQQQKKKNKGTRSIESLMNRDALNDADAFPMAFLPIETNCARMNKQIGIPPSGTATWPT